MNIELVVFDIAGTTLKDDEDLVAQSFINAIRNKDFNVDEIDLNSFMGYRKIDAIKMILDELEVSYTDQEVEEIHNDFISLINNHYQTADIEEIKGASELFGEFKSKGIKVAINTGFSRSTTDIIIGRLGWEESELIDASIASDEVSNGRPAADMIQSLMKTLDVTSSKSVAKIGDTPSDLLEGKNADCGLTIGVLYGTHTKDELKNYDHDYLISDISQLSSIIIG